MSYALLAALLTPIWFPPIRLILLFRSGNFRARAFVWFYLVAFIGAAGGISYLSARNYPSGIGEAVVLLFAWIIMLVAMAIDLLSPASPLARKASIDPTPGATISPYRKSGSISAALALLIVALAMFTIFFNGDSAMVVFIRHRLFAPATFLQNWLGAYKIPIYAFIFVVWFFISYATLILIWFIRRKAARMGMERDDRLL